MKSFTILTWMLSMLSILGAILNSRKNVYGFIVWGIANCAWLVVDFYKEIYAQAFLYSIFIGINIYGWLMWKKEENKKKETDV
ncbi:nicotinamide riboside transporter PnuC [Holospora obtusa F1]|uniref:Nicotinamide riboside transporter PnuC n=1 Tax=Holospora obtusa F1 TaxID=1399147 RepID=W6TE04_HOLOB|nr:nicotinamide mononucleotide transporter [Holospora obtusa]ETZ07101.1 nicotinamide riboside transporter PnuC [Holospora obtusa F1]